MEWTRDKTLSLINEYRKRRGLWDMTHNDYRKKEIKHKLLVEVSDSLGGNIPILEIEKKFHTLRTQYHREINRMKRKEPHNSRWFGFKTLQFLSSPKACRSSKGRIKSEITEDGTITTKYVSRESMAQSELISGNSLHSNSNINDEFLTVHRKPTKHALEKLIEETTKDVDDIEDSKPEGLLKNIGVSLDHNNYNNEMHSTSEHDNHDQHHHMDEEEVQIEAVDIQDGEDELAFQSNSSGGGAGNGSVGRSRIIKIKRDCQNGDFFDDDQVASKRAYYETNGHQHSGNSVSSPSNPLKKGNIRNGINHKGRLSSHHLQNMQYIRDEFSIYGEYVGNEMRGIRNREILITLKHKINTALFEASMEQLQKT